MGLRVKTNASSLNAQRRMEMVTNDLQNTMNKLASGERINRAADDAAGLAMSENLKAGIRSLSIAKRNASDGISLIQTAEGGLMETSNMLVRLRELAIQSASDTVGQRERDFLDKEYLALKDEINRIAMTTDFNGVKMLIGKTPQPSDSGFTNPEFPLEIQVSKSYFKGADALTERNPVNIVRLDFGSLNSFTHGEGSLDLGDGGEGTRVASKQQAQDSVMRVDQAIYKINEYRSYLGASQNRLTSTINNLGVQLENMSESNSRIRDTDFAVETANLTKFNILQQAGSSVLTTANNQPQVVLSLLGS